MTSMPYHRGSDETPRFSSNSFPDTPKYKRATHHRLLIDNRDRPGFPTSDPFSFIINLQNCGLGGYEHVLSCELKSCAFPKIANEAYVIVEIDELAERDLLESTAPGLSNKSMAIVYFDNSSNTPGFVKPARGRDFTEQTVLFVPPKRRLDRLTINFRTHSGAIVSPADTGGVTDVSMLLEIVTVGAAQLPSN